MRNSFLIVLVDHDLDNQDLTKTVFAEAKIPLKTISIFDGVQLMDYLLKRYKYSANRDPLPDLIFLDLNMPLMDGFETLREIKAQPTLSQIAVYVVMTEKKEKDFQKATALGASGLYHKETAAIDLEKILKDVCPDCFK